MKNKLTTATAVLHIISGVLLATGGTTLFASGVVEAIQSRRNK
ncbi:hypothetical protein [Lentilactobacillus sp. SPB1-3]|uniref:Uncharacterized protein n=1 Tax=Lentilactobacillus terminaliae TaxID=3003483 RepID=A0ACD5DFW4_9LACO|nr:hypothetical protein [Lentilactobacillus sp. SPB1-3]MCZ0976701.1 hypothetical protein [Lentilactobacillus sp. SPB1-3]